jgi:hypothetical protein
MQVDCRWAEARLPCSLGNTFCDGTGVGGGGGDGFWSVGGRCGVQEVGFF